MYSPDSPGLDLPAKYHKAQGGLTTFRGELQNLRGAAQPAALAGRPGVFNIFRKVAGSLDRLTGYLRSLGFPVDTVQALRTASLANAHGNKAVAKQVGKSSVLSPGKPPTTHPEGR